jgi:hypothetical protein
MKRRAVPSVWRSVVLCVVGAAWVQVSAQTSPRAPGWQPPRTPDGRPDFQGNWDNTTATQLQRPAEFKDKAHFTEEEAREYERTWLERILKPLSDGDRYGADLNEIYLDDKKVVADRRTSLIVDPPDGRLPARTKAAEARAAAQPKENYDDPEARPIAERCLTGNDGGGLAMSAPIVPNPFAMNFYQIVQTPTHLLLFVENMHDARIVRIGGTHLPPHIQTWLGDSVGRWEGDTLVVDTTNLGDKTHWRGTTGKLHVIERFTRTGPSTLTYRATVEDPDTWVSPWTMELPFIATKQRLFEAACHEGNYSLEGILRGARAEEREKAAAAKK